MNRKIKNKKKAIVSGLIIMGLVVILSINGRLNNKTLDMQDTLDVIEPIGIGKEVNQSTTAQSIRMTMNVIEPNDILLVNKNHKLDKDYEVELKWLASGREQVAIEIYNDLVAMLSDGTKEGLNFVVSSGYRNPSYQQEIWDDTIKMWQQEGLSKEEAVIETSKTLAYPGESEHATGLAVDIVSLDYQDLDDNQHYTKESTWLRENCYKYGFILRYPQGKEEVTGISYESWHFRYVGKVVAKCIMETGITLEEYLDFAEKERD